MSSHSAYHPGIGAGAGTESFGMNQDLNPSSLATAQLSANSAEERDRIRVNAGSLAEGEWDLMDEAVMEPLRNELVLTQMFEGAGLTQDLEWWQTESTWAMRGGMTPAEHSSTLKTRSEEDTVEVGKEGVAIPYSIKDYRINEGELVRSRRTNMSLDTTYASEAARKVGELVDATILYGAPGFQINDYNGNVLQTPGLLNVDGRIQQPASGSWGTGTNMVDDLRDAVQTLKTNNYPAGGQGYWLLHSQDLGRDLNNDYSTQYEMSNRQKVEDISEIGRIQEVPQMPDGTAVLFPPTGDVIDIARLPDGPLNMQTETHFGQEHLFKVYHLLAPRIKHRYNAETNSVGTGIVHIAGA